MIICSIVMRIFIMPKKHNVGLPSIYNSNTKMLNHHQAENQASLADTISINPSGTMANDTVSIVHHARDSAIVVTMRADGRCPNPYLMGRLSGPALVLLEWSNTEDDNQAFSTTSTTTNTKIGRYQVPFSGTYFLEIIAIMCQDFSRDRSFHFRRTCVEAPINHRLTKSNVKIQIQIEADKTGTPLYSATKSSSPSSPLPFKKLTGFWLHQQDERAANNDYAAVYTRFQPRGCLRLDDPTHEHFEMPPTHCIEPTDLNRFEPYTSTFRYYTKEYDKTRTLLSPATTFLVGGAKDLKAANPTTICLVGYSHSRTLLASMTQYHNISRINNNIHIEWIRAKSPRDVNNKTITTEITGACDKIILAVGQWPASFSGGKPDSFEVFDTQIRRMFVRLQAHLSPQVDIVARSIHYNPLNERIGGYCPPKDWRSPTVLDGYNDIIQQACIDAAKKTAVATIRYVDTNFIVGPLWDASSDWGHVCNQASHVEALYLLAATLGRVASS